MYRRAADGHTKIPGFAADARGIAMTPIFETLAPILLLIALGAALAHLRFLGREFMADLNKLVFWIALPALIFTGIAGIGRATPRTASLLGVMTVATFLVLALGWLASRALRLPPASTGTLVQAAFRGNLAYIGIPVLAYAFAALPKVQRDEEMATALLVMAPMTALYNVLAVVALQGSQHKLGAGSIPFIARNIATNPLIIACVAGLAFPLFGWHLPLVAARTLGTLGAAAVPVALLCIGGSLATLTLRGRRTAIVTAAVVKVFADPLIVLGLCKFAGIAGNELRIALVLAACPTAVASFVMAEKLNGDESLASGSIALSTVLSSVSLLLVLWIS
ncbi:MAG: AEC family transporter [Terrimicrobiaceae bacterium]|nr:AEC family transporter [Terrimicrobiaceae bacterium]